MRYIFVVIISIHALIHLMGFVSAFFSTSIEKQVLGISKPIGAFWLISFILLVVSSVQFLNNKRWFYIAFLAVLLSQILIVIAWKDAKYGTILNGIIFLVSFSAYGNHKFNQMVNREIKALLITEFRSKPLFVKEQDVKHLPHIVQKWLNNSGIIGKERVETIQLKQKGQMLTKPNGNWKPFEATQYFNIVKPSFVWHTDVNSNPIIKMKGRDKLINGKGEMLINLAGLIPIVKESKNKKINQGAMLRYLAELCWFPQATIKDYLQWETINATIAKATFTYNSKSVSGIFKFSEDGDFLSFEADRYYGGGIDSKLEKWAIKATAYNTYENIKIPSKCTVIWKLADGDFEWLQLEITDILYN